MSILIIVIGAIITAGAAALLWALTDSYKRTRDRW